MLSSYFFSRQLRQAENRLWELQAIRREAENRTREAQAIIQEAENRRARAASQLLQEQTRRAEAAESKVKSCKPNWNCPTVPAAIVATGCGSPNIVAYAVQTAPNRYDGQ